MSKTAEEILESTAGHPIDAMHQYADQRVTEARNKAIDEAIELVTEGRTVRIDLVKTLESLKVSTT